MKKYIIKNKDYFYKYLKLGVLNVQRCKKNEDFFFQIKIFYNKYHN